MYTIMIAKRFKTGLLEGMTVVDNVGTFKTRKEALQNRGRLAPLRKTIGSDSTGGRYRIDDRWIAKK